MKTKKTVMIAGLLGIAALLTGCGIRPQQQDTASYEVADKVAGLRVESDSGNIEVVESDRQGIHVTETLSWRKNKPATTHAVEGDTLVLKFTCPVELGLGGCEVDYRVEVPRGLRVNAESDSGGMSLRALSGEVEARSDSGTIEGAGLVAKNVLAHTDSGTMELAFSAQPDKLVTTTDSGTTKVRVPEGGYRITAKTDSGSKDIDVPSDPKATRSISLSSDSGSLAVSAT